LLVAEVFIPSGGMILIVALACVAISIWCAGQAWWHTERHSGFWLYLGALVVLLPAVVVGAFYVLPRTDFGKNLLMQPQDLEELTPYAEEEEHLAGLVGKTGTTLTLLNPGGLVLVDGERLHCESEGLMIDPDRAVRVLSVKGNRLVVRTESPASEPSGAPIDDESLADESALDFEVPPS